jgi:hypothetical protein
MKAINEEIVKMTIIAYRNSCPAGSMPQDCSMPQAAMASVLFAAVALLAARQSFGHVSPEGKPLVKAPDGSRWMEDHLDAWGKRPLRQWVLPASHDSAMYESGWVKSLAQTQDLSVYQQLKYGIRYFDLRPQLSDGEIYMHHGPVLGPKLADVLDDVRRLCREPHRELIILKFSHYEAISDKIYRRMVEEITARLDPWLYKSPPIGKRLAEIPLRDLLKEKNVIWVVCDGVYPLVNRTPGIWVYRDWSSADPEQGDLRVYDRYADSTEHKQMKDDQFGKFVRYNGKCKRRPDLPCDLFLLSWTLTPATGVRAYSELPNRKLNEDLKELECPNRFGCIPNLLYADYVESAHLLDVALRMNEALEKVETRKHQ